MWHTMYLQYNECDTPCDYNIMNVTHHVSTI